MNAMFGTEVLPRFFDRKTSRAWGGGEGAGVLTRIFSEVIPLDLHKPDPVLN